MPRQAKKAGRARGRPHSAAPPAEPDRFTLDRERIEDGLTDAIHLLRAAGHLYRLGNTSGVRDAEALETVLTTAGVFIDTANGEMFDLHRAAFRRHRRFTA